MIYRCQHSLVSATSGYNWMIESMLMICIASSGRVTGIIGTLSNLVLLKADRQTLFAKFAHIFFYIKPITMNILIVPLLSFPLNDHLNGLNVHVLTTVSYVT